MWARQVAREIGIAKYVDSYASKNYLGKGEISGRNTRSELGH